MGRELGEKAAEFSNGLFSAKDWACSACGNINFARRLACNICGVQKFKAVEDRSGVGGGFNDREGLEYKEVIVEEGEYDEFGRKKKRKRNTTARIADPLEGGMDTGNMNTKSTTDFLKENHPQGLHGNPKSDSQSRSRSPVKCKDHKYTSRRRSSSRSSSRTRLKDSRSRSRSRSFSRSS
ncbi:zinc finger Ran-binding domain-containing protein 2-like [Zophobas morio]|uniref:zinc finger Ran-binding domain-containing protein 2-like n=1 Tax=Zophobas morio TaxID=2755281 RepID=UPI003083247D